MTYRRILSSPAEIGALAERLAQTPDVTRFDEGAHREAWTLAHAFADLEESFEKFLTDQLPRLVGDQSTTTEIPDILLEIGEEFRHILYHIRDPKFYGYLQDGDDPGEAG